MVAIKRLKDPFRYCISQYILKSPNVFPDCFHPWKYLNIISHLGSTCLVVINNINNNVIGNGCCSSVGKSGHVWGKRRLQFWICTRLYSAFTCFNFKACALKIVHTQVDVNDTHPNMIDPVNNIAYSSPSLFNDHFHKIVEKILHEQTYLKLFLSEWSLLIVLVTANVHTKLTRLQYKGYPMIKIIWKSFLFPNSLL